MLHLFNSNPNGNVSKKLINNSICWSLCAKQESNLQASHETRTIVDNTYERKAIVKQRSDDNYKSVATIFIYIIKASQYLHNYIVGMEETSNKLRNSVTRHIEVK